MRSSISGWSVKQSNDSDSKPHSSLARSEFVFGFSCDVSRRKLIVPQKEASPFLDKKIDELEVKLADMEDADDDLEEMDEEDDAPETPSMPQMQTPLANDMETMPYTPSQVPIYLKRTLPKKPKKYVQINTQPVYPCAIVFSSRLLG